MNTLTHPSPTGPGPRRSAGAVLSVLFRSPRLALALLLAMLLTACASPLTTRVTSFNQWPADAAGSTFSYITPVDITRQLEQATYENYVQAELEKRGLKRAA